MKDAESWGFGPIFRYRAQQAFDRDVVMERYRIRQLKFFSLSDGLTDQFCLVSVW